MSDPQLPGIENKLVTPSGNASTPFYRWFQFLSKRVLGVESTASATAQAVAQIAPPHIEARFPLRRDGTDQNPELTLDPAFVDSVNRLPIVIPGQDGEPGQDSYIPGPKGDKGEPGALGVMVCEEHYHDESVTVIQQGSSTDTSGFLTSASIVDSIADSDTDHAPSRNAVYDALALKLDSSTAATTYDPIPSIAILSSANALADNNSAQDVFPSANNAFNAEASTAYEMEAEIAITGGSSTHSVAFGLAGTATLTSIGYRSTGIKGGVGSLSVNINHRFVSSASSTVVTSSNATANSIIHLRGIVRVNAAGTLIPQIAFSAAPGGSNQVEANSFVKFRKIGINTVTAVGNWS